MKHDASVTGRGPTRGPRLLPAAEFDGIESASFFGADGEAGAGQVVLAIHAVGNDVGHCAQDTWGIEHRTDGVASCSYPLVGVVLTGWGSAN